MNIWAYVTEKDRTTKKKNHTLLTKIERLATPIPKLNDKKQIQWLKHDPQKPVGFGRPKS